MMNRSSLRTAIREYVTPFEEEERYKGRFLDLLFFDNCFERSLQSGHITASAWVLTPDYKQVALLHHKKLDRWLQPGGHADGDEQVQRVALKELEEETGITDVFLIGDSFFDIDIHTIPARKEVPEHEHFDIRFAFVANVPDQLKKNEESNEVAWIAIDKLEHFVESDTSVLRMKEKTLRF
ncbi:NUDIX domain-containing protein [Reichenbachiella faecimaris]|uniref:NUDIX domain-containing protein n=1 Tax=Reichenbachiella faecimaris TaxID=692418 RepID=A0A1W2GPQ1_REIFA|nr:NUDIX hydrolase [Reichenbachiella faecimaris]SMD38402.1 NUDIX domain-containing protein [Reichenbachiella faecimaris]